MVNMFVYVGLLIFFVGGLVFFQYKENKKKYKLLFLLVSGGLFIILSSLRYKIGFDYSTYETLFYQIGSGTNRENIEIGFLLFNKAVFFLGGNYRIFLFIVNSIMTILVFWWSYQFSKFPEISVFFYFTFQFWACSMNLLRQSIALSIFLLSYQPLLERNFIKYTIIIFIAASFHQSILIMIPFYFLLYQNITKPYLIVMSILFVLGYVFFDFIVYGILNLLFSDYQKYIDTIYWNSNSISYIIFPVIYLLFILYYAKKLINDCEKNKILINSCIYSSFISFFITKHFILERFSLYFFIFSLILIPEIIFLDKKTSKKNIVFLFSIVFGLGYFSFSAKEEFHNVYPYRSVFDKAISSKNK